MGEFEAAVNALNKIADSGGVVSCLLLVAVIYLVKENKALQAELLKLKTELLDVIKNQAKTWNDVKEFVASLIKR